MYNGFTRGWSTRDRVHAFLLLLAAAGLVVHHAVLWHWYVEDSAISFAYARHLIEGEGLVAFRGGERVEGYSNPTWVAVLAFFQLIGFDPFFSTKYVQAALGILTLPVVYLTVRETTGRNSDLPIVSVVFLAVNAQFAIWGGAGLENGLLNFLIALGFWRMMVELRQSTSAPFPWSSAIWLLVALTRPEGLLYSAVAGFCTMIFQLHAGRSIRGTLVWLTVFFVPFGLYHAVHLWYFAWPLPNTYYAKLEDRESVRWIWTKLPGGKAPQAWNWTRNFFHELGQGYFLPIWILGVTGDGRVRYAIAAAAFLLVGATIELSHDQRWLLPVVVGAIWVAFWLGLRATEARPPRWLGAAATLVGLGLVGLAEILRYNGLQPNLIPVPEIAKSAPPYVLACMAILLGFVGFGARGWQLRVLSWLFCCAVVFFAIYVQWDWMKGFRWYATAAVPGAILFAFGVDAFVRLVEDMFGAIREEAPGWRTWSVPGTVLAVVLLALQVPGNVMQTRKIVDSPDASPKGIKTRVDYVDRIRDRLHIEERLVDLDVDQGAHLWWSDFEMMDVAGLVDLPRAHHGFEKSFIREYVFEERRPHYAHIHGGWATNSKIPTHPEWRKDYVEIQGYPAGKNQFHVGNFVRRDLLVGSSWPHGGAPVTLANGIVLYGAIVDSEPAAGRKFSVEVGFAAPKPPRPESTVDPVSGERIKPAPRISGRDRNFRTLLFASDGTRLHSWDIPPGYDWLKPEKWNDEDVFVGRFDLSLPEAMPPGTYDLGFVFLAADGTVLGPVAPTGDVGGEVAAPRMAAGEILYPGALTVLTPEARGEAAAADRDAALAAALRLDCEEAERSWLLAKRHRAGDADWVEKSLPDIRSAFATCWARAADGTEQDEQVRRLVRAREWDWWNADYRTRATALADRLHAEGLAAREAQDWETAYRRFSDAVDVDRARSWSRRYAEEARAWRLGIDPESLEKKALEVARKKDESDKIRAKRASEAEAEAEDEADDAPLAPEGM